MNINEPKLFLRNGQREVRPKYTDLAPEHAVLANLFFDMVLYSLSKWKNNMSCTHLTIRLHGNTYFRPIQKNKKWAYVRYFSVVFGKCNYLIVSL